MTDCKPSSTPATTKECTFEPDPLFDDVHLYRSLVGSLQYLTLTKPEITHSVNMVCQHMRQPYLHHFNGVKRILRYVKGTIHQGLCFSPDSMLLQGFSDTNWAGDSSD